MNMHKFIDKINLSKHVANHIVGKNHSPKHRKIAGGVVMFVGVTFAHLAFYESNIIIKLVADVVGYSIHGIGLIPFLKELEYDHNN